MGLKVITTADGSHSLLNEELQETYHSIHGALQESKHVFIENGFHFLAQKEGRREIRVLEVGFGTGLNALLTLEAASRTGIKTHYHTLEAYPLTSIAGELNYDRCTGFPGSALYFDQLHSAPWEMPVEITDSFCLEKHHIRLEDAQPGGADFDLVYYDAFAPSKQPDLWTIQVLEKIEQALKTRGVFVTYCARGQLKRDLRSLGLEVQTLPGPPGKKEMVRAIKG